MPGPSYPNYTQLDADQVLQRSFDEANDRLRVDASVTATIAGPFDVSIEADADNIAIRNSTNSNELLINNDGSINTNITGEVAIELDAADGDNVAISDGTDTLAVNADGSLNITDNGGSITVDGAVVVSSSDLDIRDLSHSQDSIKVGDGVDLLVINADGSVNITDNGGSITVDGSVTVSATDLDIRDLSHSQDSVKIGDGTDELQINGDGSVTTRITDSAGGSITLGQKPDAQSVPVALSQEAEALLNAILTQLQSNTGLNIGTEDGTVSGTQHVFVNNVKQMILAAQDRAGTFTWLDVDDKKNRRLSKIDYTSATFPGIILRKQFSYTLHSGEYVLDGPGNWSIV